MSSGGAAVWPDTPAQLERLQRSLAALAPSPWEPSARPVVGACYVCFARGSASPGRAGEMGWAGAALKVPGCAPVTRVVAGAARAPYEPGHLALREGPLRAAAVAALPGRPDVLLVDATGRDHPRGAGLALHLGWALDLPTVGVTDRALVARGGEPADRRGAAAPLLLGGVEVARWVRTRAGVRPLVVHAGWRTTLDDAVAVVLGSTRGHRTPQPLRAARRAARARRGRDGG